LLLRSADTGQGAADRQQYRQAARIVAKGLINKKGRPFEATFLLS